MLWIDRNNFSRWYACLFAAMATWLWTGVLQGQTVIEWNNPAGGIDSTAANWNPANVPDTDTETARFNLQETMTIRFGANYTATIDDLLVHDGDVTFSNAGSINDATLNISNDAFVEGGNLTLTRVGATTADVNLVIADLLVIQGGSELKIQESAQAMTDNLFVAFLDGNGTLRIESGGQVTTFEGSQIGVDAGSSSGAVTVIGAGSTWTTSGPLTVGVRSDGTLDILDGGNVSNNGASIGNLFGSGTVTVSGAGST